MDIATSDWEFYPTPDIHSMFDAFDLKFFQSKLQFVQLEWSKIMYSCAGICYSKTNRCGITKCIIRLSEPLLKQQTRKHLVEALLFEMTHAHLFVLGIREENEEYEKYFKSKIKEINSVAGTHITAHHSFYNAVKCYKQHWWRCNGICQNRRPFFGYVRSASNCAPGPNDRWWKQHRDSCFGIFRKLNRSTSDNDDSNQTKSYIKTSKITEIRIDDDLSIFKETPTIIDLTVSDEENEKVITTLPKQSVKELLHSILQEIKHNSIGDDKDDVISFLDSKDLLNECLNVSDTSIVGASSSVEVVRDNDIINCPLCHERMIQIELSSHLEGCMGV